MKSLYKTIILILPLLTILYGCDGEKDIIEIELPHHYKNVYILGEAVDSWDSNNPQVMDKTDNKDIFVFELD